MNVNNNIIAARIMKDSITLHLATTLKFIGLKSNFIITTQIVLVNRHIIKTNKQQSMQ
jgi:hypothetical protein